MPATAPIYEESAPEADSASAEFLQELPDRIGRLETGMAELRDTISRFAELMIGEVKDLRQSHADLPGPTPPTNEEVPVTAQTGEGQQAPAAPAATTRRPWLLMELLADFASTFRMYFDPRYRVRRATQLLVPLIVGLLIVNFVFFRTVFVLPIISTTLEKLVDIVLAILLYKVISREIYRYRQVIGQLVTWQSYQRRRASTYYISSEPGTTRVEME